jgi:hypothetical protein
MVAAMQIFYALIRIAKLYGHVRHITKVDENTLKAGASWLATAKLQKLPFAARRQRGQFSPSNTRARMASFASQRASGSLPLLL